MHPKTTTWMPLKVTWQSTMVLKCLETCRKWVLNSLHVHVSERPAHQIASMDDETKEMGCLLNKITGNNILDQWWGKDHHLTCRKCETVKNVPVLPSLITDISLVSQLRKNKQNSMQSATYNYTVYMWFFLLYLYLFAFIPN